jgi:hypothetical protein
LDEAVTHAERTDPTLATIREQAGMCGIMITAEREASILAGARYLHDAARRLDSIAAVEESRPDTIRR